jgi:hypothetical protein
MKIAKTALVVLMAAGFLGVLAAPVWAQTHGGTGILKIKPAARASSMGQAGVAVHQRAHSLWWNPALLAQAYGREVSSTVVRLVPDLADDVYYLNMAYAANLEGWGGFGVEIMYLSYGKTEAVDTEGESYGFFSSYELVPSVGFGTRLVGAEGQPWGSDGAMLGSIDVGIGLKYVWVDLAPEWAMEIVGVQKDGKADAFAVDLGGLIQGALPIPSLSGGQMPYAIGVNIQNLGSKLVYIEADQGDPLPRNLKLGLGLDLYRSENFGVLATVDFNQSLITYEHDGPEQNVTFGWGDAEELWNMGLEASLRDRLSFRLGYVHDPEGEIEAMTFGAGLDVSFGNSSKIIRFDYSSVPQALDLDRVSYLSVGVLFQ